MSDLISKQKLIGRVEASWRNAGLHTEDYKKFKKWINSPTVQEYIPDDLEEYLTECKERWWRRGWI